MSSDNISQASSQQRPNQPIDLNAIINEHAERWRQEILGNPLAGLSRPQVQEMGQEFARMLGFQDDENKLQLFRKAAIVTQTNDIWRTENQPPVTDNNAWEFTEEDFAGLQAEAEGGWKNLPSNLRNVMAICCLCAVIQGHNETAVNGANIFYKRAFGLADGNYEMLYGLVNSAPYLCCAILGCWLTAPLNSYFGRRGTIVITCVVSFVTSLSQFFAQSWWQMFLSRFLLGLGIGPQSATVPIFSAEAVPAAIRGSLVMMWQVSVAVGILLGLCLDAAFYHHVGGAGNAKCKAEDADTDTLLSNDCSLNWRLMVASPMVLPIVVIALVLFWRCPESPRFEYCSQVYINIAI